MSEVIVALFFRVSISLFYADPWEKLAEIMHWLNNAFYGRKMI
jgi:hypothetical protein